MTRPDEPASPASKLIFAAGIGAVAIGRVATIVRNRQDEPALEEDTR